MRFKKDYIVIHSYLSISSNNPMIVQISNVLANVGKNDLHCTQNEDFAGGLYAAGL